MAQTPGAGAAHSPPYYQPSPSYPSPSPHSPIAPYPQQKSQRLSPNNATSPYASPHLTNGTVPNTNFFAPTGNVAQTPPGHNAAFPNGTSYVPAHGSSAANSMAPPSTPGAMGPPSKPVEDKPVDVNDLGDVLSGTAVDLKEEEANLTGWMRRQGPQSGLYNGTLSTPAISEASTSYFDHPTRGMSVYSPNVPGSRASFYGAGSFNQPRLTEEQFQEDLKQKQKLLVRRRAEIASNHQNNSFLEPGKLSFHIRRKTEARGIKPAEAPNVQDRNIAPRISVMSAQNGDRLAVANTVGRPIGIHSDILTTVSLAAKDRIRNLLEHAIWMARSRKETSGGVVPPELKDIAISSSRAEEIEVESPSSAQSKKRSFADSSENPPDAQSKGKKVKTIKFSNLETEQLNGLIDAERELEKQRIEKRAARTVSQLTGDGISSGTATPGGPGTPGSIMGSTLADMKKLTKKELKKATESRQSEADIAKASNSAASMALGGSSGPSWLKGMGGGSKKKGADWLKSKQGGSTSFSAPASRTTSSTQVPKTTASTVTTVAVSENRSLKNGEQREDAVGYRDIQVRDLLRSLELDGKEKRALTRAYNKQD